MHACFFLIPMLLLFLQSPFCVFAEIYGLFLHYAGLPLENMVSYDYHTNTQTLFQPIQTVPCPVWTVVRHQCQGLRASQHPCRRGFIKSPSGRRCREIASACNNNITNTQTHHTPSMAEGREAHSIPWRQTP